MLTTVTITGLDEAVPMKEIEALSRAFPFVEWGVLISERRMNTKRYPGWDWIKKVADNDKIKKSAHLCGGVSRDAQQGVFGVKLVDVLHGFERIQLNGWTPRPMPGHFKESAHGFKHEYILQAMTVDRALDAIAATVDYGSSRVAASVLFDPSGGKGIALDVIPEYPGFKAGYAGGIGLHNVASLAERVSKFSGETWIDMESGARDQDDNFDVNKVAMILERAAKWVAHG